ncbi:MAG: flagellar hook-length control protein FliK [Planctomycetota bacterium]
MAPNQLVTDLLRSPVAPRPSAQLQTSTTRTGFQDYLDTLRSPQQIPVPPPGDPPGPTRPRATDNPNASATVDDDPPVLSDSTDKVPDRSTDARPAKKAKRSEGETTLGAKDVAPATDVQVPVVVVDAKPVTNQPTANVEAAAVAVVKTAQSHVDTHAEAASSTDVSKEPDAHVEDAGPISPNTSSVKSSKSSGRKPVKVRGTATPFLINESTCGTTKPIRAAAVESPGASEAESKSESDGTDESDIAERSTKVQIKSQVLSSAHHVARDTTVQSRASAESRVATSDTADRPAKSSDARVSIQDQKVKIADSNRAEQGLDRQANRQSDQRAELRGSTNETTPVASKPVGDRETFRLNQVSVQSASGDGAAAGIAKFLVVQADSFDIQKTPTQSGSAIAPAATANVKPIGGTALPVTQPSSTVASLLTSGTTDADPVASAAKLLRASGVNGQHQATLKLDPPELGQLRIDIRMREQGMTLRVDAENAAAAKLIESRLPELKDALAVHGIRFDRSEIVVRSPETSNDQPAHSDSRDPQGDMDQSAHQQNAWFNDRPSDSWQERTAWTPSSLTDNVGVETREPDNWNDEVDPASYESVDLVA